MGLENDAEDHSRFKHDATIDSSSKCKGPYSRGNGSIESEGPRGRGSPMTHPCQEGVLQEPCSIGPLLGHPAMSKNLACCCLSAVLSVLSWCCNHTQNTDANTWQCL